MISPDSQSILRYLLSFFLQQSTAFCADELALKTNLLSPLSDLNQLLRYLALSSLGCAITPRCRQWNMAPNSATSSSMAYCSSPNRLPISLLQRLWVPVQCVSSWNKVL